MVTVDGTGASGGKRKKMRRTEDAESTSLAGKTVDFPGQETCQSLFPTGVAGGDALSEEAFDDVVDVTAQGAHSTMRIFVPASLNSNRAR